MQVRARLPPGVDGWGYSLKGMMGMVVIGGFLITATYWLLQRTVVPTCALHPSVSVTLSVASDLIQPAPTSWAPAAHRRAHVRAPLPVYHLSITSVCLA